METKAAQPAVNKNAEALEKIKSAAEQKFLAVKTQALELSAQVTNITITDETTLGMANQLLSKVKELDTLTDKKRAEMKKPYLETGKMIDSVAKQILDVTAAALEAGKAKLKEWNDKQTKLQQAALEGIELQRQKLEKRNLQLLQKADECVTPKHCQGLIDSINEKFIDFEKFGPFADQAKDIKKRFIELLTMKKTVLEKAIAGEAGSTEAVAKLQEAAKEVEIQTAEANTAGVEKAGEMADHVMLNTAKSNVRKIAKAQIVDPTKLPREWLMPDMDVINAHLKTLKDGNIQFPVELNGVRFYIDETPIIKG